jgi:hypothetical protein
MALGGKGGEMDNLRNHAGHPIYLLFGREETHSTLLDLRPAILLADLDSTYKRKYTLD